MNIEASVRYFLHIASADPRGTHLVWQVGPDYARRMDVTDSPLGRVVPTSGKDVLTSLREAFGLTDNNLHELELAPGEYYPRMARPVIGESRARSQDRSEVAKHARASTTGQLHALIQQLEHICRVVHPVTENFQTFGHEVRHVIILACTEVEAQWKAILKSNGVYSGNTEDYVKLATPMKLAEYAVEFPYYPWMPAIRPFETWYSEMKKPTQNLAWYNAYNNVKHDRDTNFQEATLGRAFEALAGLFVMICSQYGWEFALEGEPASRAFFRLTADPSWTFSEYYVPAYDDGVLKAKQYPFPK